MSLKNSTVQTGALVLALVGTATFAGGHGADLDPAVNARHSHMQLYAFNLGVLGGMAQGEVDYDAAAASTAASNLAMVAGLDQSAYWTEGTEAGTAEGSRALPAIWENMADYDTKNADMLAAAEAMAAVAGDGLEAVQANIRDLGGACSACHREYRQRQQ